MTKVIIDVRIQLECENPEVTKADMANCFVAGCENGVPLWLAVPHDATSMMWATDAKIDKIYWGGKKVVLRQKKEWIMPRSE